MTVTPLRLSPLLGGLIGLALVTAPSLARAIEANPGRLRLSPAQQQKLYPEWRRLLLQTNKARIATLQKHQQCISAASTIEALQACQRQERQALNSQRQQHQEAMRQLLQRHGIQLQPGRQDGSNRRQQPQSDGLPTI